ncbi:MAG: hypothetical protein KDB00_11380 [Planctomycetales bacterium]|nr:hypothetical protein [Planctomycetales bacterium]
MQRTRRNQSIFFELTVIAIVLFCSCPDAIAQSNARTPHLAYMYPAGCERGMSCEVVVGGQHLKDVNEVYVSGDGVDVEIIKWYRPLTAGEYNNLRTKFRDTRERLVGQATLRNSGETPTDAEVAVAAGITEEQLREMEIYRKRDQDPKRQPNEQLEEQVTLRVTVALEATLGKREVRFMSDHAISNPIWFNLDRWIEFQEFEPNDIGACDVETRLPVVINGQIMPGDVDRFRFQATQGMRLVIQVAARDVIPYLADAVPGWFQAVVRITDAAGNEISYADSFYYRQDPVLYFEVPHDGTYIVEIRDALYRGREDFVYRMTIGEIPFVTSVFPLGARVDSKLNVQMRGWNLTKTEQDIQTMSRQNFQPLRWYASMQGDQSVRFPMQIDHSPEVFEEATNDDQQSAQEISNHTTINGRIETPGDRDVYRITGSGRIVAEVHARRLGSPLDSVLTLTDGEGNIVAFNDDHHDAAQALLTHHADSYLSATLSAKSDYYLTIADAQGKGGPDFGYRIGLRSPLADYELRVVPSTIVARPGQSVPITVYVLRKDGFDQEIELSLVDAPAGFKIAGSAIPGRSDQIQMTLSIPDDPSTAPAMLEMQGTAPRRLHSRSMIVRPAVPAENMMQAFIWHHLVPVDHWNVIVSGRPSPKMPLQVAMPQGRIALPSGGSFLLPAIINNNIPVDQIHVDVHDAPDGISAYVVPSPDRSVAIRFDSSSDQLAPGLQGNLLISVYTEFTPEPTEADPAPKARRTDYGLLPAIPFEVTKP